MTPSEKHRRIGKLADKIDVAAKRKRAARDKPRRSPWRGLGVFGLVGWAVALPTVGGAILGAWIDAQGDDARSWTLSLLLAGLVMGCFNAWYWIERERRDDD